MSIVILTMAFAAPQIQSYTHSQAVQSAARQLYTRLQLARLSAVKENVRVALTVQAQADSGEGLLVTVFRDPNGNGVQDRGEQLLDRWDLATEASTRRITATSSRRLARVIFQPNGTANGNQTITLRHGDTAVPSSVYQVTVNATGGLWLARFSGSVPRRG